MSANPGIAADEHLEDVLNQRLEVIRGSVPALGRFPSGCRFRGRCTAEIDACAQLPEVSVSADGHIFKCWNPVDQDASNHGAVDVVH